MRVGAKRFLCCFISLFLFGALLSCSGVEPAAPRSLAAGTLSLGLPLSIGELERPAVDFKHDGHVSALKAEGCTTCHPRDSRGKPSQRFGRVEEGVDRTVLMDLYHDRCMGCHAERSKRGVASGPITCGECHVKREPAKSERRAMTFDYSLHFQHVKAEKERCDGCHHVKNDATGRLEYKKGAEESCGSCHGRSPQEDGKILSLKQAAHASCIGCHLDREKKKQQSGPVTCQGCHGPREASRVKAASMPRLLRGQPDLVSLGAVGGKRVGVPFDHKAHETMAPFCSSCHHESLSPCKTCHTQSGSAKGGGVTLEAAYHRASSERSCVGCHNASAEKIECAGCHHAFATPPAERACGHCHVAEGTSSSQPVEASLAALPASSPEFPETVTLASLAKEYKPSILPHRQIVARLDAIARQNPLARHFHGSAEVLCAGCHHQSPTGMRPPACRSCHTAAADPTRDKPGLKAAYHRQCIGCHQKMGIQVMGCTDCHDREERR